MLLLGVSSNEPRFTAAVSQRAPAGSRLRAGGSVAAPTGPSAAAPGDGLAEHRWDISPCPSPRQPSPHAGSVTTAAMQHKGLSVQSPCRGAEVFPVVPERPQGQAFAGRTCRAAAGSDSAHRRGPFAPGVSVCSRQRPGSSRQTANATDSALSLIPQGITAGLRTRHSTGKAQLKSYTEAWKTPLLSSPYPQQTVPSSRGGRPAGKHMPEFPGEAGWPWEPVAEPWACAAVWRSAVEARGASPAGEGALHGPARPELSGAVWAEGAWGRQVMLQPLGTKAALVVAACAVRGVTLLPRGDS